MKSRDECADKWKEIMKARAEGDLSFPEQKKTIGWKEALEWVLSDEQDAIEKRKKELGWS